jgi:hypothetical protein
MNRQSFAVSAVTRPLVMPGCWQIGPPGFAGRAFLPGNRMAAGRERAIWTPTLRAAWERSKMTADPRRSVRFAPCGPLLKQEICSHSHMTVLMPI